MPMSKNLRLLTVLAMTSSIITASTLSGTLRGQIVDERGRPVGQSLVKINNVISGYSNTTMSSNDGTFFLTNIPSGSYHIEAIKEGEGQSHSTIEITTSLPLKLSIVLKSIKSATVNVTDEAVLIPDSPSSFINIEKNLIDTIPTNSRTRGLEQLLMMTPGFAADENGRFHFRGTHGQSTYVVDGIPITDKIQAMYSNTLNPEDLQNIEVLTGGIPAEYGGKPIAVFNLTTKSGLGLGDPVGNVSVSAGSFSARETTAQVRGGSNTLGYFASVADSKTDRFLDPVNFENLNNQGSSRRFYTRFDYLDSDRDIYKFSFSGGSSAFGIPNLASQEAEGQNISQKNQDINVSLSYTRVLTDRTAFELRTFYRRGTSELNPTRPFNAADPLGGPDFPAWISSDRTLETMGTSAVYSQSFDWGNMKHGIELITFPIREALSFYVLEEEEAESGRPRSVTFTPDISFPSGQLNNFNDSIKPRLNSAFSQVNYHQGPWKLALGLRADQYSYRDYKTSELQPRLGVSYRFDQTNSLIRASYDRLLIIPDNEFLAISSRGNILKPELQNSMAIGIEQGLGSWGRIFVEYWDKQAKNAADAEQLFNTGILFPIHLDKGNYRGWNFRFDARHEDWSSFLSLGKTRAIFVAPFTGGLLLEEAEFSPGTAFLIDHDQELAAVLGLRYQKDNTYVQVMGRYDSGLVAGDPADGTGTDYSFGIPYVEEVNDPTFGSIFRIKPRTIWSVSVGFRVVEFDKKRNIDVGLDALNIFDKKGLYNFLSVFSGTHVIPPRTFNIRIKYQF